MVNCLHCLLTYGDCQIIDMYMYVFSLAFFTHVLSPLLSSEVQVLYLLDFVPEEFSDKLLTKHTLAVLEVRWFQFIVNWSGVIINYF